MANRGAIVEPNEADGTPLKGTAQTATFTTEGFSFSRSGGRLGIWLDLTVSGTSPTLDIDVEMTMDGTTYGDMTQSADVATKAAVGQLTATGAYLYWFENAVPWADDAANYKVRLECSIGGTTPSFTFNEAKVWVTDGQN